MNWCKCSFNLKWRYTKCILIGHVICVTLKEKILGQMPLGSLKTKIYVKLMTLGVYLCLEGYRVKYTYNLHINYCLANIFHIARLALFPWYLGH